MKTFKQFNEISQCAAQNASATKDKDLDKKSKEGFKKADNTVANKQRLR